LDCPKGSLSVIEVQHSKSYYEVYDNDDKIDEAPKSSDTDNSKMSGLLVEKPKIYHIEKL
jgi:hypothetical protein